MSEDFISDITKDIGKLYTESDNREAFIKEFEDVIEKKVNDFPLTSKEINNFWNLLKKYKRTDTVNTLAYKILLEKLLIFCMEKQHLNDRKILREIFHLYPLVDDETDAEENKRVVSELLADMISKRGWKYFIDMAPKITAFLNSFYFYQLPEIDPEAKDAFETAYHILKNQANAIINVESLVKS